MSRKKIIWTDEKVNNFIKQGRGQGEKAQYIPWLSVGEFSSLGRSHRIKDTQSGRIHHFFSDLEKNYYYYLIWNEKVIDIREQYPLFPSSETEEISLRLNVRHPAYKAFNIVMITDFLITTVNGLVARSIKPMSDLKNQRIQDKLKIEEMYWKKRDIDFIIVTEESFSKIVANNVEKLFGYYEFPIENISDEEKRRLSLELIKSISNNPNKRVNNICNKRDIEESMNPGSNLKLFWHLACRKKFHLF